MSDADGSRSTVDWAGPDEASAPGAATPTTSTPPAAPRYQLLAELGRGGMAVVHVALDCQLQRRVAVKLVRPDRLDARGRARLLREAGALARLRHPNVVQVYDAGRLGDDVFIAMELLEGGSLERWLVTGDRATRDVVRLFVGAGRGLAAAHAAGLVHRDFKPDNVLLDRGVARVADFGLATDADQAVDAAAPAEADAATVTQAGAILGTPAFMAPEQLDGTPAGPAADQFAFCVALYRALFGVAPFPGDTIGARRAAIAAGRPREPAVAVDVPRWLRAAVVRGLAERPEDRHPSMEALVAELARERGWRRWRVPILGGVAAAAAAGAIIATATRPSPVSAEARCDGGAAELSATWSVGRRDEVTGRLTGDSALAVEVAARVAGAFDQYARDWSQAHRAACVAHARGVESDRVLDLRMRCLRQRLAALSSSVATLVDGPAVAPTQAVDVAVGLAPIADCSALDALTAELPPPADPRVRVLAEALTARLTAAEVHDRAGQAQAALAEARAVASEAAQIGADAVAVAAALAVGRIAAAREQQAEALAPLREAERQAFAAGAVGLGVEAAARRLYVEAVLGADAATLTGRGELLEPLSESLPGDRFVRPLLLNNLGVVHLAAGDRARARPYFERAHQALTAIADPAIELLVIDRNLALVSDGADAGRVATAAWRALEARLGPGHPTTLEAHSVAAHLVLDPVAALALATAVLEGAARFHPDAPQLRGRAGTYAAFLTLEVDPTATAAARARYQAVRDLPSADDDVAIERTLAAGQLALLDGDWAGAEAAFAPVVASHADHASWWERDRGAVALVGVATARAARGDRVGAEAALIAAITRFDESIANGNNQEPALRRARAQLALAALVRARDPARADSLTAAAVAYHRATGSSIYADLPR